MLNSTASQPVLPLIGFGFADSQSKYSDFFADESLRDWISNFADPNITEFGLLVAAYLSNQEILLDSNDNIFGEFNPIYALKSHDFPSFHLSLAPLIVISLLLLIHYVGVFGFVYHVYYP
jgi:hypothetical protein